MNCVPSSNRGTDWSPLAAGNCDHTITGRFDELRRGQRIMSPERDTRFVTKPNGITIHSLLPMKKRSFQVPDSSVLHGWAAEPAMPARNT